VSVLSFVEISRLFISRTSIAVLFVLISFLFFAEIINAQTLGIKKDEINIIRVIRDGAPLYSRANGSSGIVRTATVNEEFPFIDQIQGYYLVKDEVTSGFLYLDPLDAVFEKDIVDIPSPQAYIRAPDEEWYWIGSSFFVIEDEYKDTYHSGRYDPNYSYIPMADPQRLINTAMTYIGVPYVWGGESKNGVDCSGLVLKCLNEQGFKITHKASIQAKFGKFVPSNALMPGDAIFFADKKHNQIGHVGLYIGNGRFIHAASSLGKVSISNLDEKYYREHYVLARRY
jgi:hypothetical protein